MSSTRDTTSAAAFEARYRRADDPWSFASSPYELARYDAIIEALPRDRYRRALEPGCSIGVLTARLAGRCDRVDALDLAPTAVTAARARCAGMPHVTIEVGRWPDDVRRGPYDLVVLSEVGYYQARAGLLRSLAALEQRLETTADLVAVHWLGNSDDHVLHGDDVHEAIAERPEWTHLSGTRVVQRSDGYRLDVWRRGA